MYYLAAVRVATQFISATFTDTFKAGASLYGIGDLETLARDTTSLNLGI